MAQSKDPEYNIDRLKSDREETMEQLVVALEDYVILLNREIESMVTLAFVHGWQSGLVEEGKAMREKIADLKSKI